MLAIFSSIKISKIVSNWRHNIQYNFFFFVILYIASFLFNHFFKFFLVYCCFHIDNNLTISFLSWVHLKKNVEWTDQNVAKKNIVNSQISNTIIKIFIYLIIIAFLSLFAILFFESIFSGSPYLLWTCHNCLSTICSVDNFIPCRQISFYVNHCCIEDGEQSWSNFAKNITWNGSHWSVLVRILKCLSSWWRFRIWMHFGR